MQHSYTYEDLYRAIDGGDSANVDTIMRGIVQQSTGRLDFNSLLPIAIKYAIQNEKVTVLEHILGKNISADAYHTAIYCAAENNKADILEKLVADDVRPDTKKTTTYNSAFICAVETGMIDTVNFFLDNGLVDPAADDNAAITNANRIEIIELLLKHPSVDPSVRKNEAICKAVRIGNEKIVNLLLKDRRVNVTDDEDACRAFNLAFIDAAQRGYAGVVRCLLLDGRV